MGCLPSSMGRQRASDGTAALSLTVNIDPSPKVDFTSISPPISSAKLFTSESPNPVPSICVILAVSCTRENGSKAICDCALVIPTPVSATLIVNSQSFAFCSAQMITDTEPIDVYLIAFEMRFVSICFSFTESVSIVEGTFPSLRSVKQRPFNSAFGLNNSTLLSSNSTSSTARFCSVTLPASTAATSRTLPINSCRWRALSTNCFRHRPACTSSTLPSASKSA